MDVVVGRIGRAHGVRGELSIEVRTDEPDRRFAVGARLTTDPVTAGPLTVVSARPHRGQLLLRFREVADRTAAEGLRGVLLSADQPDAEPPAAPDEFYDRQLVGLRVLDHGGADVGEVVDVLHHPAHEVLVVSRGGYEVLVPFVRDLVPTVDLATGVVGVADVPGLLDPERME